MYPANHRNKFLKFLRTGCLIFGHWPLNSKSRWKRSSFEVLYSIQFVSQLYGIIATINGFRCCFHSLNHFVKSTVDIIFALEMLYNSVYVRRRRKKFRRLATEMEHFFNATNYTNLKQPIKVCFVLMAVFVISTVLYGIVPFFTEWQITPLSTVYFTLPREKHWGRNLTFALNIFNIINTSSFLFLDMLVILIMWHVACKFSLLGSRFTLLSEKRLKLWIRQHQDVLRYTNETNSIIALLVVKSTCAVALNIIICGLVTLRSPNFIESIKFFTITIFSVLRFVICSWVADTMTENANGIAWKIYDSPWTYTSPRIRKMTLLVIQRCQKPVAIHATGFLSSWTLKFCGQALYTVVTYFMTLRAVIRG